MTTTEMAKYYDENIHPVQTLISTVAEEIDQLMDKEFVKALKTDKKYFIFICEEDHNYEELKGMLFWKCCASDDLIEGYGHLELESFRELAVDIGIDLKDPIDVVYPQYQKRYKQRMEAYIDKIAEGASDVNKQNN